MDILCGWQIDEKLNVFRIPIRIINPDTQDSIIKHCLYDTGFSGYLGLDKDTISLLKLNNIGHGKGLTITGIIEYNNFEGFIEIINQKQEAIAKIINREQQNVPGKKKIIPIQEFDIPIIGIKSILQFSWLILSEKNGIFLLN